MPAPRLLEAIREFTTAILNPYDLQDLLHRLLDHTLVVTGAQGAGIMLSSDQGLGFASATADDVVEIEVTQDRVESGPCHEAFFSNEIVLVDDLEREGRWPEYRQRALQLGFRAVVGIPLDAWGQTIGVLDLYRHAAGPLSEAEVDAAVIMAAMGAGYILHAHQTVAQHDLAAQLQSAVDSRDTIGQAKGMLMARHRVDADQAFGMLRSLSQQTNRKLRDVARQLVESDAAPRRTDV
jgi:GAF domain-containing protein